jgi:uncharacterized iron-regulated membrane protein
VKFRSVLFWLHLACGVSAGLVILIMSVTGVLLTYQRQITAWADTRGYLIAPSPRRASVDELLASVRRSRPDVSPTAVVVRSDPTGPASITIGSGRQLFVDPYTGSVLGEGNGASVRGFFRVVVEWHRYLATSGVNRPLGRAVTGAANLAFLFIVMSGLILWVPRSWSRAAVRNVSWFRGGLRGKARDFNWHNTIGLWSAIPLAVVVAGGTVISYPWATALVYRAYGENPPAAAATAARARESAGAAIVGGMSIDAMIQVAAAQVPDWKTITVGLPASGASRIVLTLDSGDGGQPEKRGSLTLDRSTGALVRWEPFASQSPGRRARTWLRFAHTGEVYGMAGQTVAGIASAAGAILVWTGLALALRRFTQWRKRSTDIMSKAA